MTLPSALIKQKALNMGFSACGFARADVVEEFAKQSFRWWIENGFQGEMTYMRRNEDKRLDPRLLVEGAKTVISVALNYYPSEQMPHDGYQIAWYAYGKDYHEVMKAKLKDLLTFIAGLVSPYPTARVFCDTAPVMERYWAWRAGLGWIGKHTQLIIPHGGSCFFLGEIIIDVLADRYDSPQQNRCGVCRRCIDACPAKALEAPFHLNANKCLSYLTIEHKGALPPDSGQKMDTKIYGCDDCQRACPWNRYAKPNGITEFAPSPLLLGMRRENWENLTEEQYKELFKGSAVKRAKYRGLKRNIDEISLSSKTD